MQELYGATQGTMTRDNLFVWLTFNVLAGVVSGKIDGDFIDLDQLCRSQGSLACTLYLERIKGLRAGGGVFILPEVDYCGQPTAFEVLLRKSKDGSSADKTLRIWPLIAHNTTDAHIARHAFACVSAAVNDLRVLGDNNATQPEKLSKDLVKLAKKNASERKTTIFSIQQQISAVRTRPSRSLLRKGRQIHGKQFTFVARQSRYV